MAASPLILSTLQAISETRTVSGQCETGVVDGDQLIDAVRAGYERGKGSLDGYDPGR